MKIIHSADWQLGCPYTSFGAKGPQLRSERIATLKRTLDMAQSQSVDAFIIAGDLFDDNQVSQSLLLEVHKLLASFSHLRIYILPGNHDPLNGPGCIWKRAPFKDPPPNVTVFTQAGTTQIGNSYLLANPLQQKLSTIDPTACFVQMAADLPSDAVKIGITHGSPAIEGKHQPNDYPIHLEAATRANLDYLAIGHWHGWQVLDQGRMVMPGTPEPDTFDHNEGIYVALVELGPGHEVPRVQPLKVAGLTWKAFTVDLTHGVNAVATLEQELKSLAAAGETVVRVTIEGSCSSKVLTHAREQIVSFLAPFKAHQLIDRSSLALTEAELQAITIEHPLLGQALGDLAALRTFTGRGTGTGVPSQTMTLKDGQELAAAAGLNLADLDEEFFKTAVELVGAKLQEVAL